MKVYLATTNDKDFMAAGRAGATMMHDGDKVFVPHLLLSYHYFKNYKFDTTLDVQFPIVRPKIFCDSGAFSAKMLGVDISIEEYGDFLEKYKDYFDVYSNLDVISDSEATAENQAILEDRGLKPIPVFHLGTPFEVLDAMCDSYDYIALGGLVPHKTNNKALMKYLIECFQLAKGRSKFHGFGLTRWETIRSFPFRSVDSSSWNKGVRFGQYSIFNERYGRFDGFDLWNKSSVLKHAKEIRNLGFDPYMFIEKDKYDRITGCKFDGIAWAKAGLWLTKFWKQDIDIYWAVAGDICGVQKAVSGAPDKNGE